MWRQRSAFSGAAATRFSRMQASPANAPNRRKGHETAADMIAAH